MKKNKKNWIRERITTNYDIKVVYFALFATIASLLSNYVPAIANDGDTGSTNILDKEKLADLFDIGSGIFAAILATLSLIAYRNLHSKRMLLVSAAFGMFSIHAIVTSCAISSRSH